MDNTKQSKKGKQEKPEFMVDLFDKYSKSKICDIPKTNTKEEVNTFATYRPKRGHCLEYDISQTDAKLDAGNTKIKVKQTKATYVPVPPEDIPTEKPKRKRKFVYSHAGPPCWEFIDEKFRRKQEVLQQKYRGDLSKSKGKRLKAERKQYSGTYYKTRDRAGPAWFQELSPKQLRTVENLQACLEKDLREQTIINTKENIGELGIVLRPNRKHLYKALLTSYGCPTEFLLVLYQLMNKDRKFYSLNDRLLLSAVVHLNLIDTLRELHVRIPSPPRQTKEAVVKVVKTPPRVLYDSPYLIPYTYEKEPRKFTGIYRNKHVQHPESPYFSYLPKLKRDLALACDFRTPKRKSIVENELLEELEIAQDLYNNIHNQTSAKLVTARLYIRCDKLRKPKQDSIKYQRIMNKGRRRSRALSKVDSVENLLERYDISVKTVEFTTQETTEEGLKETEAGVSKPEKEQKTESEVSKPEKEKKTPAGVSKPKKDKKRKAEVSKPEKVQKTENVEFKPEKVEGNKEIVIRDEDQKHEISMHDVSNQTTSFTNSKDIGLETKRPCCCNKNIQITPEISEPEEPPDFVKKLDTVEDIKEAEPSQIESTCVCKAEAINQLERTQCKCPTCTEKKRMQDAKYIISGMTYTPSGQEIPIISGAVSERQCDCLIKYNERVQKVENYRQRLKAREYLKSLEQKYVIGGVVNTQKGPVYMINGIRPVVDCACAKAQRAKQEEEKRLAAMPPPPKGRVQYVISGVKQMPHGNVYILSSALPIDQCECEKLYEMYAKKHSNCIEMFDEYLRQIKVDTNDYLDEMNQDNKKESLGIIENFNPQVDQYICKVIQEMLDRDNEDEEMNLRKRDNNKFMDDTDSDNVHSNSSEIDKANIHFDSDISGISMIASQTDNANSLKDKAASKTDNTPSQKNNAASQIDNASRELDQCKCNCEEAEPYTFQYPEEEPQCDEECYMVCVDQSEDEVVEETEVVQNVDVKEIVEVVEKEKANLKRYCILKKFPSDSQEQENILKDMLKVMADDGFPLARLPNCHMLPHFKLWMQMRCKVTWTLQDKFASVASSINDWRTVDKFYKMIKPPTVEVSKRVAKTLTWRDNIKVRKMVERSKMIYREISQNQVDFGRIFFVTLYDYEFPNKTFRDVYFAYTPSKEEEAWCYNIWESHEIKNFRNRQSCLCKQ